MLRANRGAVRLKRSLAYVTACLPLAIQADYAFPSVAPGSSASLYNLGWTFYYEDVLGTSMQLTLRTSAREAVRAREAVLTSIDRDDKILSTWRSDSELSRWLDTRNRPVPVSSELLQVLSLFDRWHIETDGPVNPAAETTRRMAFPYLLANLIHLQTGFHLQVNTILVGLAVDALTTLLFTIPHCSICAISDRR